MLSINFCAEMAQAIHLGHKTMTRRPFKNPPLCFPCDPQVVAEAIPKYEPGDLVYVKEPWAFLGSMSTPSVPGSKVRYRIRYTADDSTRDFYLDDFGAIPQNITYPPDFDDLPLEEQLMVSENLFFEWWQKMQQQPPNTMPAWAARSFLRITFVHSEPLHKLSEHHLDPEGMPTRADFIKLWDRLYKEQPAFQWARNPLVWVYHFEKVPQK